MKYSTVKILTAGVIAWAGMLAFGTGLKADTLDTAIPSAGISVTLSNYMDTVKDSESQIVDMLPEKAEKVEKARNPIFDNMAIAFVDDYVNVRKKPTTESKIVGKIYSNCSATILKETPDGWYKIKSGNVTGFIKAEYFLTGADAEDYAIDNGYVLAQVKEAGLRVREHAGLDEAVIRNIYQNEIYAVTKYKSTGKWAKLDFSDSENGWVSAEYIDMSVNMDTAVTLKEERERIRREEEQRRLEEEQRLAEQALQEQQEQQQQQAYAPDDSAQASDPGYTQSEPSYTAPEPQDTAPPAVSYNGDKASQVVAYAKQFLGNPYVYGGSSLTNGTDCSGFTMSVYAHFGYSLNRSSYTQVYNGSAVNVDSVQPGDLIFYKNGGTRIGHVAMYIGGGQVIHASTPSTGITISSMYHSTPCAARRIIN